MSAQRSLLAIAIGFGLSLSACAGEPDSDFDDDLAAGSPEMEVMGGGETLPPPGSGSGPNGAWPQPHCIKGMAYAMTWYPGWNPDAAVYSSGAGGYWDYFNPALDWVRCDGNWMSPGTSYSSPRITMVQDGIRAMAWAGAHASSKVKIWGVEHPGNGWFTEDWATQWLNPANADIYGGLIAAKWNRLAPVPVMVHVEDFVFSGSASQDPDLVEYTLVESMVLFDPLANNPWQPYPGGQCTGSSAVGCPVRELRYFISDAFGAHCPNKLKWMNSRSCHSVDGCPELTPLPESQVANHCTLRPVDPAKPGESPIERAVSCYGGRVRPVKVYVRPGDFVDNWLCETEPG